MRQAINALCMKRLGRLPDLENPKGFNDKIQWLKLFDQRREHITACDKWAVRDMIPPRHLIPARMGVSPEWMPMVLKCTHDSGGTRIVSDERGLPEAQTALMPRLGRSYGVDKGEWAYQFVPPRLISEQLLEDGITDYKFHCVHGRVAWVQVYDDFTPEGAAEAGKMFVGSDQAWISYRLGWDEPTWGPEHGVVWWGNRLAYKNIAVRRVMFFPGYPKPWHVPQDDPLTGWVKEHYCLTKERMAA